MAIVPQDISLFHRTVLENIRYARPDASEEDVLAAAEMANCREFIEAMPDGFATMVGIAASSCRAASGSAWRSLGRC